MIQDKEHMDCTVHPLSMSEALQILGGPGKELGHILSSALFAVR